MQAFYLTVAPAMVALFIMPITNNQWTLGHNQDFWLTVSGIVAKYLGNPKQDVEQMKFPKGLEFLKVPSILTAIIMLPIFFIFSLLAGPSYVEAKLSGSTNWLVWILVQSVMMGAGIEILLLGVRMFIGEIIPAFRGISEKLLPGAMMGLDCPTIYPFARPDCLNVWCNSNANSCISLNFYTNDYQGSFCRFTKCYLHLLCWSLYGNNGE
jgi:PTS system ascorbate-specific IIC component